MVQNFHKGIVTYMVTRMIMRWKGDNYVLISLKMYKRTFSNTSGNVLETVIVENDTKFPQRYGNIYGNACDTAW